MISLFGRRRTLAETGALTGMTDWHSHILPGVDDGLASIGDSLEALREYEALGIREVWLTPHVMEDMPNTTEGLRERFAELRAAYGGPVELHLAAEYMMDPLLGERLRSGDLLPIGSEGRHLLVETSYFSPPARLGGILGSVRAAGYFPVLAHPERYLYPWPACTAAQSARGRSDCCGPDSIPSPARTSTAPRRPQGWPRRDAWTGLPRGVSPHSYRT